MATIQGQPALAAFLDLIAWSEGTSSEDITQNDGYDVIVTGIAAGSDGKMHRHEEIFTDYSDHPFAAGREPVTLRIGPPPLRSTASGRYQIIIPTWRTLKEILKLGDFSPLSQDLAAIQLVKGRAAFAAVEAGQIAEAIALCSKEWASFPGNDYGQGGRTVDALLAKYGELQAANA